MNDLHDDEVSFLSCFVAAKLQSGGEPWVSSEELRQAYNDFKKSWRAGNHIKHFNFDDLETLGQEFQKRASQDSPSLEQKPYFEYKDGRLYVTYAFHDIVKDDLGAFKNFFCEYEFKPSINKVDIETCDKKTKSVAKATALYITKFLATSYINHQVEEKNWPKRLKDLSYIFTKDLGKTLELQGTKKYFVGFFGNTYENLLSLLKEQNGELVLSSIRGENLEFNNLARVISGYPKLDGPQDVTTNETERNFRIRINDGHAVATESKLEFSDPYGEWSDEYSYKKIDLNEIAGKGLR